MHSYYFAYSHPNGHGAIAIDLHEPVAVAL